MIEDVVAGVGLLIRRIAGAPTSRQIAQPPSAGQASGCHGRWRHDWYHIGLADNTNLVRDFKRKIQASFRQLRSFG
jgi:hypothetical protein